MKVSVIIPAAGTGSRMKADKNKQFLTLGGKEILAHTIAKFIDCDIYEIIVVTKEDELNYCKKEIIKRYSFNNVRLVKGGLTRQESVYNGLQSVSLESEIILIHDGARPLIKESQIQNIIASVKDYGAVAFGVPLKDTVKVVDEDKKILNTPKRDSLVAIQTPQAFNKEMIIKAYRKAKEDGFLGTDSSSLVERAGGEVRVLDGSYENIKITTPEDLYFAQRTLSRRKL
ncbi:2-C-methyl-D-erythritol 4-phosphate cytidylyltransferase [Halonatronum saccharophilum]|uniref:2-C-methyl-D-erythritol 4-phosphate cytidylyltransferase n=1 Tax=Halonatronum saccharophilum TaxID=150060 RepID=UPI0004832E94|nr:2-C-methyl-D-erythritol 4-phosphate cytidylyltransferase [Halonatronum saccharophilum]